jgi:hypothetical protein
MLRQSGLLFAATLPGSPMKRRLILAITHSSLFLRPDNYFTMRECSAAGLFVSIDNPLTLKNMRAAATTPVKTFGHCLTAE